MKIKEAERMHWMMYEENGDNIGCVSSSSHLWQSEQTVNWQNNQNFQINGGWEMLLYSSIKEIP